MIQGGVKEGLTKLVDVWKGGGICKESETNTYDRYTVVSCICLHNNGLMGHVKKYVNGQSYICMRAFKNGLK